MNSIDELQNLLVNQNNTQNSNKQLEIEAKIRETDQKMYENEIRMQENEAKTEKIAKEKSCLYLVLKKIRNMIIEEEIRNCFDEFLATSIEITRLELQKTEILIQNEEKTEFDRRKLNEINIEIEKMYRKKDILENDLSKIELFDRKRENSRRKNSVDNSSLRKSEVFETKNLGKNPSESGFKSIEFNKPQIVREFSSGKYVSYGDNKLEKNIPNFSLNTMGDLRSKLLARNNKYF